MRWIALLALIACGGAAGDPDVPPPISPPISLPVSSTGSWTRLLDQLADVALAADDDGAIYVAAVARTPTHWGHTWLDEVPGTLVARIEPDGTPGWSRFYPGLDGAPKIDARAGRIFAYLGRLSPLYTSGDRFEAARLVSLDRDGQERWRRDRTSDPRNALRLSGGPGGESFLHGTTPPLAPFLEELDAAGNTVRTWGYDPGATAPPPYTFGRDVTIPYRVTPWADGSLIVSGLGLSRFEAGVLAWRHPGIVVAGPPIDVEGDLVFLAFGQDPAGPRLTRAAAGDGTILWSRSLSSGDTTYAGVVRDASSGHLWVAGSFAGTLDFDGQTTAARGSRDLFFGALTPAGEVVSVVRFGSPGEARLLTLAGWPAGGLAFTAWSSADPTSLFHVPAVVPDALGLALPRAPRTLLARIQGEDLHSFARSLGEVTPLPLFPSEPWFHVLPDVSRGLDGNGAGGVPLRTLVAGGLATFLRGREDPALTLYELSWAPTPDVAGCDLARPGIWQAGSVLEPYFLMDRGLAPAASGVFAAQTAWLRRQTADSATSEPALILIAPSVEAIAGCGRTTEELAALAADAAARRPPIRTHVVAIGPPSSELDALAQAGGTERAIQIPADGDVAADVTRALEGIRRAYRCDFGLWTDEATLAHTRSEDLIVELEGQRVERVPACADDGIGWYALDDAHPRWLRLCPASCEAAYQAMLAGHDPMISSR